MSYFTHTLWGGRLAVSIRPMGETNFGEGYVWTLTDLNTMNEFEAIGSSLSPEAAWYEAVQFARDHKRKKEAA